MSPLCDWGSAAGSGLSGKHLREAQRNVDMPDCSMYANSGYSGMTSMTQCLFLQTPGHCDSSYKGRTI